MGKETRRSIVWLIVITIALLGAMQNISSIATFCKYMIGVFMPFFIGGAIAFIMNIPMKAVEKRLFISCRKFDRFRRPLSYLIALGTVIGIFVLGAIVVMPQIKETVSTLIQEVPGAVNKLQIWVNDCLERWPYLAQLAGGADFEISKLPDQVLSILKNVSAGIFHTGYSLFTTVFSGAVTFFIGFVFSIYVLMQKETLKRQGFHVLQAMFPMAVAEKIQGIVKLASHIFSSFLSGQCLEAVILGTLFVVTMAIFQMPYAVLIGVLIAFTALIPIFGAFLGCGIGVLLIAIANPGKALWFIVLFLILQQIEGNLIYPNVVGSSVGLPSIWVLVAVTIGADLFGIAGIILFIPLCSVLYAIFREWVRDRLRKKRAAGQLEKSSTS